MAARADITITADGTAVGLLTGATVRVALSSLPVAGEDAYGYGRGVPGVLSWSAQGEWLVPTAPDAGQEALRDALTGRATVAVVVTYEDGTTETGTARVTAWEAQGAVGEAVRGAFELSGTGALTAG